MCRLGRHGDGAAHDAVVDGEDGGEDRHAAVTAGLHSMEPLASW
mgnify:CR=1 FL=1